MKVVVRWIRVFRRIRAEFYISSWLDANSTEIHSLDSWVKFNGKGEQNGANWFRKSIFRIKLSNSTCNQIDRQLKKRLVFFLRCDFFKRDISMLYRTNALFEGLLRNDRHTPGMNTAGRNDAHKNRKCPGVQMIDREYYDRRIARGAVGGGAGKGCTKCDYHERRPPWEMYDVHGEKCIYTKKYKNIGINICI